MNGWATKIRCLEELGVFGGQFVGIRIEGTKILSAGKDQSREGGTVRSLLAL
jgi:hypothetical protein